MTDQSEFLAKVDAALEEIEGYGMLPAYAAHSAACTLAANWRDAVADGSDPKTLIRDIDDTIRDLHVFKRLVNP